MANTTFTSPGEDRYFEDYVPKTIHEFGPISVKQDDLTYFAKCYAPQSLLTDPESTQNGFFGYLDTSECLSDGMTRLLIDYYLSEAGNLSPPEIYEIRWIRPLCPSDKLILQVTVTGSQRSNSESDCGIVYSFIEVLNQNRVLVMSMRMKTILFCSPK